MEAHCKVIPLKTAITAAYDVLSGEQISEPIYGREEASLVNKALCILKEIEEEWEADHLSIGIRDKIHLLAYYLEAWQGLKQTKAV